MAAISKRPRLNGIINRIKLVGIELEGGWDVAPSGEEIGRDGSVKFLPQQPSTSPGQALQQLYQVSQPSSVAASRPFIKGEIVSKPLPIEKIEEWVRHAYPQHVNETCGLHVHMSFHYRSNYARLMTPDFTPFIVEKVKQFCKTENITQDHPQWKRVLNKDHPHCAHQYLAEGQVKMTRKDYESRGKPYSRYTFVNYCAGQHNPAGGGTVEIRGLAMFDTAEQAIRAIMTVVNGTNEFLSKIRHREKPARVFIKTRPEVRQEFRSYLKAA